ncbi:MAG: cysteine--tRNA ligase [Deltaproteobacteria bacterium]|nr:cysteine--tRNA ligase [Deltaproteobacteria bacterium]
MTLRIFNTLTRTKEVFVPREAGKVGMYVCGPTVYDLSHLGHARSVLAFDVIYRYLCHLGYQVTFVRNITDIDDKIIVRAQREGTTAAEVARRFTGEFHRDMAALGLAVPTVEPCATQHLPAIIRLIERLLQQQFAYQAGGDVYFAVKRFAGYGRLSKRNLDELLAGARVEPGEQKADPLDFALWKAGKPGEPVWDSPWGPGRPGWHVECSAMSQAYLGASFDIHGGGQDLVFPHHENEIAQSEAATGQPFVRYWIHNGFVNLEHEKMSKSLGNILTIRDLLSRIHPEAIRLFVLAHHYRRPIDYTAEQMAEAQKNLDYLYLTWQRLEEAGLATLPGTPPEPAAGPGGRGDVGAGRAAPLLPTPEAVHAPMPDGTAATEAGLLPRFREAMNEDFNTALALAHLFDAARALNKALDQQGRGGGDGSGPLATEAQAFVTTAGVLGLFQQSPAEYFRRRGTFVYAYEGTGGLSTGGSAEIARGIDGAEVERLIAERQAARQRRDWGTADRIRADLLARGIVLEDTPKGTVWKVKG